MAGRGTIALSSIRTLVREAGADTTALPDLEIEYVMLLDLPGDSLALRDVQIVMGDVSASGGGVVRDLMGERSMDFGLSGDLLGSPLELRLTVSDFETRQVDVPHDQFCHRSSGRSAACRHDFAQVLQRPAIVRRLQEVLDRDELVDRRR